MSGIITRIVMSVFVVLSAFTAHLRAASPDTGKGFYKQSMTGGAASVHDGDTLTVTNAVLEMRVRLNGIDAPELGQEYGTNARDRLTALVANKSLTVYYNGLDRYGRVLGWILDGTDTAVNLRMVREGHAWYFTRYSRSVAGPDRPLLSAAMEDARGKGLGLWAHPHSMPPWDFRKPRSAEGLVGLVLE